MNFRDKDFSRPILVLRRTKRELSVDREGIKIV